VSQNVNELEAARITLQLALDGQKTQSERNRLGQFATPPGLAAEIVKAALAELPTRSRIRFFDPAFGTGSFYSALLGVISPQRLDSATGYEVDPHYGQAALGLLERQRRQALPGRLHASKTSKHR
jgi:adenine-specific DNA-methyltransferase